MQHKNSTDIHQGAYVQNSDPGAVGAGLLWINTVGGAAPYPLFKRNLTNTGWDAVGSTLANVLTTQGDMLYGAAGGATTRLAAGTPSQVLCDIANAPAIANPSTGPISAAATGTAANFPPNSSIELNMAWGNALGRTGLNSIFNRIFYTTQATGLVTGFTVTVGPAPTGATKLLIYGACGGSLGELSGLSVLLATLNNPSTVANNTVTVTGMPTTFQYNHVSQAGGGSAFAGSKAINASVNTTGGSTPTWIEPLTNVISSPCDLTYGDGTGKPTTLKLDSTAATGKVLTLTFGALGIQNPLNAPTVAPIASSASAGFTANTTYFVSYVWYGPNQQKTALSPATSFTTPASAIPQYLITLPVPAPDGVTEYGIYLTQTTNAAPFYVLTNSSAVVPGQTITFTMANITGVIGSSDLSNINTSADNVNKTTPFAPTWTSPLGGIMTSQGDMVANVMTTGASGSATASIGRLSGGTPAGVLRFFPGPSVFNTPTVAPTLSNTPAATGLAAGTYTVAYVWTRGADPVTGVELETNISPTATVTIAAGDSISVTIPVAAPVSTTPGVGTALANIYISPKPGVTFMSLANVPGVHLTTPATSTITSMPTFGFANRKELPSSEAQDRSGGYTPAWSGPAGFNMVLGSKSSSGTIAALSYTGISQDWNNLSFLGNIRSAAVATTDTLCMQFNQDVGANYNSVLQQFQVGSTSAATEVLAGTSFAVGLVPGANAPAGAFGHIDISLGSYWKPSIFRAWSATGGLRIGTTAGSNITYIASGDYNNVVEPIVAVNFFLLSGANFGSGTIMYLNAR